MKRKLLKSIYYYGDELCEKYFTNVTEKLMNKADDFNYKGYGVPQKIGYRALWVCTAVSAMITLLPLLPTLFLEALLRLAIGKKRLHDKNFECVNVPILLSDGTEDEVDVCCTECADISFTEFEILKSIDTPIQLKTNKTKWSEVKKEIKSLKGE